MLQHLLLEDASLWEKQKKFFLPVVLMNACDLTNAVLSGYLLFAGDDNRRQKFRLFSAFLAVYKKVTLIKEIRPADSKQTFFPELHC